VGKGRRYLCQETQISEGRGGRRWRRDPV
jgi:hypothetical protein